MNLVELKEKAARLQNDIEQSLQKYTAGEKGLKALEDQIRTARGRLEAYLEIIQEEERPKEGDGEGVQEGEAEV